MTTKRRQLTDEQIAARDARRARFSALATQVGAMSETERAQLAASIMPTTIEGRPLSVHNACLIAIQCPTATLVGGFNQWIKAGRYVRKGEHGLMIWAPAKPRETTDQTETDKPKFIMVTVFDVSQTDPLTAARVAA